MRASYAGHELLVGVLARRAATLLAAFGGVALDGVLLAAERHHRTLRFAYALAAVLGTVLRDGFCKSADDPKPEDGEGEDGEGGQGAGGDGVGAGTGMGDGKGEKDVSDQIENQGQVEDVKTGGESSESKKKDGSEPDDDKPEPRDRDEGLEMDDDFDGDMHDVSKAGDDQRQDDDKKKDDEDDADADDNLDKQMGDVDNAEEEVLDEQMWDDKKDELDKPDDELRDADGAENDQRQQGEAQDTQTEAKGGDDDDDDGGADGKDDRQSGKDDRQSGKDDDDDGDGDASGEKETAADGDDDAQEDAPVDDRQATHGDDQNQEAAEDRRDTDKFELPDDMALDGDGSDDDEAGGNEEDEQFDDPLSKAEAEVGDGDEKRDENGDGDAPEEPEAGGDEEKDDPSGGQKALDDDDDKDGGDKEEEMQEDAAEQEQDDGAGDEQADAPIPTEQPEKKENDGEREGAEDDKVAPEQPPEAQRYHQQDDNQDGGEDENDEDDGLAANEGIADDTGKQSEQELANMPAAQPRSDSDERGGEDDAPDAAAERRDDGAGERQPQSLPPPSGVKEQQEDEAAKPKTRGEQEKREPNPFRSLGDALKKWKEKLKMLDEQRESDEQRKVQDDAAQNDDEAPDAAEHEFKQQDDADADQGDAQTLADATAEQAEQQEIDLNTGMDEDGEVQHQQSSDDEADADEQQEQQPPESDAATAQQQQQQQKKRRFGKPDRNRRKEDDAGDVQKDDAHVDEDARGDDDADADAERLAPGTTRGEAEQPSVVAQGAEQEIADEERVGLDGDDENDDDDGGDGRRLTAADLAEMRAQLQQATDAWRADGADVARAEALWQRYEAVTHDTAMELCEQLRLILEPTLAAKMRGDYRTGKRVNMRKVIAYVASQFKKDKIWLRRTKPSARQYQVLLAIDDSASMADNGAGPMALESLATIATAMARLEVGQIGVARFGERFELVHALDEPFATPSSGAQCVARFSFREQQTNMLATMSTAVQTLLAARQHAPSNVECAQLIVIISDGRTFPERAAVRRWVREAFDKRILVVFIVVDSDRAASILDVKSVTYAADGALQMASYIDEFPFKEYVILRSVDALPDVLSQTLTQWFEALKSGSL
jgi:midasin